MMDWGNTLNQYHYKPPLYYVDGSEAPVGILCSEGGCGQRIGNDYPHGHLYHGRERMTFILW